VPHDVFAGRRLFARFLPFLAWAGELRYSHRLRADLIAGITVVLVLVARMKKQFMDTIRRTGMIHILGEDPFFSRVTYPLNCAWDWLGDRSDRTACPLHSPAGI
jgi:hypothetical protein